MKFSKLMVAMLAAGVMAGCSTTPKEGQDAEMVGEKVQQKQEKVTQNGDTAHVEIIKADDGSSLSSTELYEQKAKEMGVPVARIYFDFDRSEVKSTQMTAFEAHAAYMTANTDVMLTIEGHCDERGSKEYNLALGERRAKSVKMALEAKGIDGKRVRIVTYGEDKPANDNHNEAAWSENRRAEFRYDSVK